ncbi:MAG: ParB N-terminal domain-containing protein [Acidobacteria bacterium]|nr:ParB N-terminal domain-containing protein [Acidobacteriota bacterium]
MKKARGYCRFRACFAILYGMDFQEISIEEIDSENETFRISEEIRSAPMEMSIRRIGQLNPLLLLGGKRPYRVVCGFRRLDAMRRLGLSRVSARIVEEENRDLCDVFCLALRDNISHRQLDALEKARALHKLRNEFGVPDEAILRDWQPLMGLAPHGQVLQSHLMLHASDQGLRNHFKAGRLTLSSLECIAAMPPASQKFIAAFFEGVRLSAGLQKKFFVVLQDLAAISASGPENPLEDPEALAIANDAAASPFQRGEKIFAFLYCKRYPALTRAEERFRERSKSLGLPGSIRITPAPYFETNDLKVEFSASDAGRFREMARRLFEASQTPELDSLFGVIQKL